MYVYEGRDYSKETSDRDKDAFDKMVAGIYMNSYTSYKCVCVCIYTVFAKLSHP